MIINLKVKTLDSQTYEFSVDNELTIRQFKETIAEKTKISADLQRVIYCGRVLVDEKQLKEYDMDGKVVHVVERPPPSSRAPSTSSTSSRPRQSPEGGGGIRDSPIFRALDGVVLGAMTIPIAAGVQSNRQNLPNSMTPSSSFCMNRITVARHMLECANNIAAYLENPERGLNNTSLDILSQGRWTMESTVVEFGISAGTADMPQNQQIADVLQGAITAALRQSGNANVTVLQLPTVFSSDQQTPSTSQTENPVVNQPTAASATASAESTSNTNEASESADNATPPNSGATAGASGGDTSTQRTGTRVLAEVIQEMRTVQTRLDPFIQRYYELLNEDPTYEENDTTSVENAQTLFDRVSEAFHYMSHAQHAISDLMLDMSLPTPRYFCCRPILVEQSGFVSSNHFVPLLQTQPGSNNNDASNNGVPPRPAMRIIRPGGQQMTPRGVNIVNANAAGRNGGTITQQVQIPSSTQINRLLQIGSQPIEVHLQIEDTTSISIQRPLSRRRRQQAAAAASSTETATETTTSTGTGVNQARVTTATHPTTATQTRSTSRPQIQVGNIPSGWNGPVIPANMVPSFDRFLPCNSHHIQEPVAITNAEPIVSQPNNASRAAPQTEAVPGTTRNRTSSAPTPNTAQEPNMTNNLSSIYNDIRRDLQQIVDEHVLPDEQNAEEQNLTAAMNRVIVLLEDVLMFLPQYDREDYDTRASVENLLRNNLPVIINLIRADESTEFGTRMVREVLTFYRRLHALLVRCIGMANATLYWNQIPDIFIAAVNLPLQGNMYVDLQRQMMNLVLSQSYRTETEVQEYLVIRRPAPGATAVSAEQGQSEPTVVKSSQATATTSSANLEQAKPNTSAVTPMETDETSTNSENANLDIPIPVANSGDPLPNVNIGSEPWHSHFSNDWLPVITRDVERQRRQPMQSAYSDAYISGMSAKRRKLVQNAKPTMDVRGLVSDGVRRAIQTTGLQSATAPPASIDDITNAISTDPATQSSYCDALRSSIEDRLQSDPDYKPEKFPNSSKYFSK